MSFWAAYKSSKRPREVEEPSDWIQRPLGYIFAKLVMPTPLTPNGVTLLAMILGLAGGACWVFTFPFHMQAGGALLLISAILDASDGQLARMRGSASPYGRMLDGVGDLVVAVAAVGGGGWHLAEKFSSPWWLAAGLIALTFATFVTGSFHTSLYDHYKNIWMRMTQPSSSEGDDYDTALQRYRDARGDGLIRRVSWLIYLFYLKSQVETVRGYDPHTPLNVSRLPKYDPARADRFRAVAGRAMKMWRLFFGFGTVVVGLAIFGAVDLLEVYLVGRFILLNVIFYGWLRGEQRRASRAAFGDGEPPPATQVGEAVA